MKDLRPIRGRAYIIDCISRGEHQQQDFKYAISDARKIARSISAFANRDGGHLLVGVKDNGVIAGVRNEEDMYVIEEAAQLYCRPAQEIEFTAFSTGETGIVIRARVAKSLQRPVLAQEPDLRWQAYYRVADENMHAHPLLVMAWRMAAEGPGAISLDTPHSRLLACISASEPITLERAVRLVGLSKRTSELAVAQLAAMGLASIEHVPGLGFCLMPPPDP